MEFAMPCKHLSTCTAFCKAFEVYILARSVRLTVSTHPQLMYIAFIFEFRYLLIVYFLTYNGRRFHPPQNSQESYRSLVFFSFYCDETAKIYFLCTNCISRPMTLLPWFYIYIVVNFFNHFQRKFSEKLS